jgi:hypothetical protein
MFQPEVVVSLSRACSAMVTAGIGRVRRAGLVLVGAAVLTAHAGASVEAASTAQQLPPDEPLFVVESFLAARNAGDPFGATGWCAALLVLQDADDVWFPDEPGTRYWLRQLIDKYLLNTVTPPIANGDTVIWTERLTPRSVSPAEPWSKVMTIQVHALVKDGKIANLSAPYPPLPIRPPPGVTAGEPTASGAFSSTATVAPATMFLGSALVLTLTVLLIARGLPAVRAAFNRRLPPATGAARPSN